MMHLQHFFSCYLKYILGRSLMIGWRQKSWNPEGHIFWPRNLIFGLSHPWDMRKKHIFCFSKCSFLHFLWALFEFFPLYNTSIFLFQVCYGFSPRNVIFRLREPCTIQTWRLLTLFENSILRLKEYISFQDLHDPKGVFF